MDVERVYYRCDQCQVSWSDVVAPTDERPEISDCWVCGNPGRAVPRIITP